MHSFKVTWWLRQMWEGITYSAWPFVCEDSVYIIYFNQFHTFIQFFGAKKIPASRALIYENVCTAFQ